MSSHICMDGPFQSEIENMVLKQEYPDESSDDDDLDESPLEVYNSEVLAAVAEARRKEYANPTFPIDQIWLALRQKVKALYAQFEADRDRDASPLEMYDRRILAAVAEAQQKEHQNPALPADQIWLALRPKLNALYDQYQADRHERYLEIMAARLADGREVCARCSAKFN